MSRSYLLTVEYKKGLIDTFPIKGFDFDKVNLQIELKKSLPRPDDNGGSLRPVNCFSIKTKEIKNFTVHIN